MPGARIAPTKWLAVIAAAVFCALALAPAAIASSPASATIDFSEHGQGTFDKSFFPAAGFTEGSWVGYIQGDDALVGPAAGAAGSKFTGVSAQVAPATQGTAIYTLTAYRDNGRPIGSRSITVTQDTGDPETGPWGYNTVTLAGLATKARSFRLTNTFVRSSHSHITQIEFGIASITLSR